MHKCSLWFKNQLSTTHTIHEDQNDIEMGLNESDNQRQRSTSSNFMIYSLWSHIKNHTNHMIANQFNHSAKH